MNKDLLSPCGLYCGVCAIYIAHRDQNEKFKKALAPIYGLKEEDVRCRGCRSNELFSYCMFCFIRSCNMEKGFEGCYQCADFPCKFIDSFPMDVGKQVILRAIPRWREIGTEKWVAEEEARYHCPECGSPLFRGAKRCRKCRAHVDQD